MVKDKQSGEKRVPFEFIIDILKFLLEINFHRYGRKKPSL